MTSREVLDLVVQDELVSAGPWRIIGSMEAIRIETTVGKDGILSIPQLREGERVEVIILRQPQTDGAKREGGWAKGWVHIMPGFDDPIPGMEEYL